MINNEAFEKAVSSSQGMPEVPEAPTAPEVIETAPEAEARVTPEAKPEETKTEWDGDVNKLPPELQPWAKNIQRTFTKKAMADAETRKLGEEYKQFQSSQDYQAYQTWKQQQLNPQAQPTAQQPSVTEQEWADAQLDPTGQKFLDLVDRKVNDRLNQAVQLYGNQLAQLQTTQQVTQFQNVLSDFADIHPDIVELHEDGVMKPLIDEEMRSGKHNSYESIVDAAYKRANAFREKANARAMAMSQGRVAQKKGAVTATGTSTGEADIVYVDKGHTFEEALKYALEGKKVKVKAK